MKSRRRASKRFGAFNYAAYNLTTGDVPERVSGAVVSPALFPLLGVEPIKGRVFTQEEGGQGRDDVVIISARLWEHRFDSDPTIVGNKISLNGRPHTVVGIMPRKFRFLPAAAIQRPGIALRQSPRYLEADCVYQRRIVGALFAELWRNRAAAPRGFQRPSSNRHHHGKF